MHFAILDIVLGSIILLFTVRAGLRGFVQEAGGLAAWLLGLGFAAAFYARGAAFIREQWPGGAKAVSEALAFAVLFAFVFLIIKLLGSMLNEIIERLNLSTVNNCLGLAFGLFEGIAVAALVIFIIARQPLFDKNALFEGSFFAPLLGGQFEKAAGAAANLITYAGTFLRPAPSAVPGGLYV
jgi:uncharacterized membrane protein required for colicin V production